MVQKLRVVACSKIVEDVDVVLISINFKVNPCPLINALTASWLAPSHVVLCDDASVEGARAEPECGGGEKKGIWEFTFLVDNNHRPWEAVMRWGKDSRPRFGPLLECRSNR